MATNASGTSDPTARVSDPIQAPSWSAVWALTLCVATLIASEFMPVSLLTPTATDLHMTEGRAGQAIAVSGFFAVVTSLMISTATRGIDRRRVLLWLVALMMASGVMARRLLRRGAAGCADALLAHRNAAVAAIH